MTRDHFEARPAKGKARIGQTWPEDKPVAHAQMGREPAIGGTWQRKRDPVRRWIAPAIGERTGTTWEAKMEDLRRAHLRSREVAAPRPARVCAGVCECPLLTLVSEPPARGPKPAISVQALQADLEASPWEGEGYRKVWARLRVCRDIRVARKRVLRLMRENNLLSPHRCRRRGGNPHDGELSPEPQCPRSAHDLDASRHSPMRC